MNDPQDKDHILLLQAIDDPVFFMNEMTKAGAEEDVFRDQGERSGMVARERIFSSISRMKVLALSGLSAAIYEKISSRSCWA